MRTRERPFNDSLSVVCGWRSRVDALGVRASSGPLSTRRAHTRPVKAPHCYGWCSSPKFEHRRLQVLDVSCRVAVASFDCVQHNVPNWGEVGADPQPPQSNWQGPVNSADAVSEVYWCRAVHALPCCLHSLSSALPCRQPCRAYAAVLCLGSPPDADGVSSRSYSVSMTS